MRTFVCVTAMVLLEHFNVKPPSSIILIVAISATTLLAVLQDLKEIIK